MDRDWKDGERQDDGTCEEQWPKPTLHPVHVLNHLERALDEAEDLFGHGVVPGPTRGPPPMDCLPPQHPGMGRRTISKYPRKMSPLTTRSPDPNFFDSAKKMLFGQSGLLAQGGLFGHPTLVGQGLIKKQNPGVNESKPSETHINELGIVGQDGGKWVTDPQVLPDHVAPGMTKADPSPADEMYDQITGTARKRTRVATKKDKQNRNITINIHMPPEEDTKGIYIPFPDPVNAVRGGIRAVKGVVGQGIDTAEGIVHGGYNTATGIVHGGYNTAAGVVHGGIDTAEDVIHGGVRTVRGAVNQGIGLAGALYDTSPKDVVDTGIGTVKKIFHHIPGIGSLAQELPDDMRFNPGVTRAAPPGNSPMPYSPPPPAHDMYASTTAMAPARTRAAPKKDKNKQNITINIHKPPEEDPKGIYIPFPDPVNAVRGGIRAVKGVVGQGIDTAEGLVHGGYNTAAGIVHGGYNTAAGVVHRGIDTAEDVIHGGVSTVQGAVNQGIGLAGTLYDTSPKDVVQTGIGTVKNIFHHIPVIGNRAQELSDDMRLNPGVTRAAPPVGGLMPYSPPQLHGYTRSTPGLTRASIPCPNPLAPFRLSEHQELLELIRTLDGSPPADEMFAVMPSSRAVQSPYRTKAASEDSDQTWVGKLKENLDLSTKQKNIIVNINKPPVHYPPGIYMPNPLNTVRGGINAIQGVVHQGIDTARGVVHGGYNTAAGVVHGGIDTAAGVVHGGINTAEDVIHGGVSTVRGAVNQGIGLAGTLFDTSPKDVVDTGIGTVQNIFHRIPVIGSLGQDPHEDMQLSPGVTRAAPRRGSPVTYPPPPPPPPPTGPAASSTPLLHRVAENISEGYEELHKMCRTLEKIDRYKERAQQYNPMNYIQQGMDAIHDILYPTDHVDQRIDHVQDQVHGQVHDQVYDQVHGQVYDPVHDQVYDPVHDQVYDPVRSKDSPEADVAEHRVNSLKQRLEQLGQVIVGKVKELGGSS